MQTPKHLSAQPATQRSRNGGAFLIFSLVVSAFCALYAESAFELAGYERIRIAAGIFYGTFTLGSIVRFLGLFLATFITLVVLSKKPRVVSWIIDKRHALAAILLVVLVLLKISGSSLALWGNSFGEEVFNGTLFGMPRWIRADEWKVFTPFSFSQVVTGNPAISDVIRGGGTDVTMVYAQPSWSFATLFRPFLWGYLFLGTEHGLSFFWCARAILIVLVTFDFMLLITNGSRRLAAYAAILVGFAPMVEWWFAVNGTADLFIYGQGLVLTLHHLLRTRSRWQRWALALALAWLLGCYALIIYPAWQVPFVYVFGALGVWDMWIWAHEEDVDPKREAPSIIAALALAVIIAGVSVGFCLYSARDALMAESNTVYPGTRFFTGGVLQVYLPYTTIPLLSPLWPDLFPGNACESSTFASLFPVGIVLSVITCVRMRLQKHKADLCILLSVAVYAIFLWYGLLGFPSSLAKVTLLSNTHPGRLLLPMGYLDVVLLVRSLALANTCRKPSLDSGEQSAPRLGLVIGSVVVGLVTLGCTIVAGTFVPEVMEPAGVRAVALLVASYILMLTPVLLPSPCFERTALDRGAWLVTSALVVFVAGMCVNPLQRGADALLGSETLHKLQEHAQSDPDALWVTDDSIMGQACISAGIPTITSVNVYPDLDRWHMIDPERAYEDYYNRYEHITLTLGNELAFENPWPDICAATLTPDDVVAFGADYWLSGQDLAAWNSETVQFERVDEIGLYTLYHVVGEPTNNS